tara:strand:- start:386254 stop:388059 length:1806 start_codon:yes stop_codon:yes gene_type:complete
MMLIFIISLIATSVAGLVIFQLYSTQYERQSNDLYKLVRGQVDLLNIIASNGDQISVQRIKEFVSDGNILGQQSDAEAAIVLNRNWTLENFGETGRFIAGKLIDNKIYFFRLKQENSKDIPEPIELNSETPGPMALALQHQTGVTQFMSFEGSNILIAYAYVEGLDIGITARVDISEIRAPYIKYGLVSFVFFVFLISLGTYIYRRYGSTYLAELASEVVRQKAKRLESEKKYQSIFDTSEDPMWLMIEQKFIHCNEAAVEVFRAKSKEDFELLHPSKFSPEFQADGSNSFSKAEEMMKIALEKGYNRFYWTHARVDNNDPFPAEVTLTRIFVDDKIGLHAMVRDITEEKIVEENLQKALVDAERANVAKSEFLASMSHEFRTPLNAILGFSELIKAQYLGPLGSEKYGEYAGDIYTSGSHLLDLINDILDISAIEARRNPMEKSTFNMDDLAEECFTILKPEADKGEVTLVKDIAEDIDQVYAHYRGIKQIIINLLSNAIKYNNQGGKVILKCALENKNLLISVEDNGFGIEAEFLPRILEPFSRAEEDAHRAQDGTGLGLSICQKLIEAYGGTIEVESSYGLGTKVTCKIPLSTEEVPD